MAEPATASFGRRFELQRTLGVGSFGTVYLAEMESSGGFRRRVALKLLNPTWDQQSDASTRLRDEARLLGRLQHRHIVRVDDLLRLDGRWALLMEYVEGVDLECVVTPPPGADLPAFSPRAALEVALAVSAALWAAAETPGEDDRPLAVVHRDIKPSNIRVTSEGEVKVLDFGVARADFAGRESKTERVRYGSIGYMSPERLLGGAETSAGDVYSLGVVLCELLLGRGYGRCELGPAQQQVQVEMACKQVEAIAGGEIAQLLQEMLAYEADDRPSARVVEERARELLKGRTDLGLSAWSGQVVPMLARSGADDSGVAGRVFAESDVSGRAVVNSETMVFPEGGSAPAPALPRLSADTFNNEADESAPSPRGLKRAAWIAGALALVGLVAAIGWMATRPDQRDAREGRRTTPPVAVPVEEGVPAAVAVPSEAGAEVPVEEPPGPAAGLTAAPPAFSNTGSGPPPAPAAPVAVSVSPPVAPSELLRSAKFVLGGSSDRIEVQCGDVSSGGYGNALLQNFPAGTCSVRAAGATTTVNVQEPRKVECTLEGGTLACR